MANKETFFSHPDLISRAYAIRLGIGGLFLTGSILAYARVQALASKVGLESYIDRASFLVKPSLENEFFFYTGAAIASTGLALYALGSCSFVHRWSKTQTIIDYDSQEITQIHVNETLDNKLASFGTYLSNPDCSLGKHCISIPVIFDDQMIDVLIPYQKNPERIKDSLGSRA